ncbi:MAG: hypothetical protein ACOC7K_02850, partial [bacterium]
ITGGLHAEPDFELCCYWANATQSADGHNTPAIGTPRDWAPAIGGVSEKRRHACVSFVVVGSI